MRDEEECEQFQFIEASTGHCAQHFAVHLHCTISTLPTKSFSEQLRAQQAFALQLKHSHIAILHELLAALTKMAILLEQLHTDKHSEKGKSERKTALKII